MAWSGKLVGGLLGGMLGGPIGMGVGAALGHVVGDAARPIEILRLDWQHHAFLASGPGVVLTPAWRATKLVGRDVRVRVQLDGLRREEVVVPEDADEMCALPHLFFSYGDLPEQASVEATVRIRGPAGAGDEATFVVQLPNPVRRMGGNGPARAVMALVGTARAGGRALERADARYIRRTFCEGIDLDDDGLVWLHDWLAELEVADPGRLSPEKVARRLQSHLDGEGAQRLLGWCWRAVRDQWPGVPQESYLRELASALGTNAEEPKIDPTEHDLAWSVLGVARGATATELKLARARLVQRWHPDRARTPEQLVEHNRRMAEVNAAYRMLTETET